MNIPQVNTPQATIISTFIVTAGITGGIISATSPTKNYAKVNFDGGYSKIGIIYDESIYSEAEFEWEGNIVASGDFDEVIAYIKTTVPNGRTLKDTTYLPGAKITASTGIEWTASRKNFKLALENFSQISSQSNPMNASEIIEKFNSMLEKTKSEREETANYSLTFERDPNPNWFSSLSSAFK